ncbi:unnamed protein product [Prorocentrum cordatum]|uniref:Uncharacterized protein n=1 Tax=Prorocentrum cordatum TaxID=2364126 RepID=A0ABN9VTP5_9DINO|nr:unnamed protein product [Polarella glacialis]
MRNSPSERWAGTRSVMRPPKGLSKEESSQKEAEKDGDGLAGQGENDEGIWEEDEEDEEGQEEEAEEEEEEEDSLAAHRRAAPRIPIDQWLGCVVQNERPPTPSDFRTA